MPAQAISFIFYFLFSVIVFPFAAINFLILSTNILPNVKTFVIRSGSMEPAVPKGSIIYTLKEQSYKAGDVIAFIQQGNVSHRVVKKEVFGSATYYSTKGDANKDDDENLVSDEAVYGKVIAVIPFVGMFGK